MKESRCYLRTPSPESSSSPLGLDDSNKHIAVRNKGAVRSTGTDVRSLPVLLLFVHQQAHLVACGPSIIYPHPRDVLVARIARVDGRVRIRQHVDGRLPVLLAGGHSHRPQGGKVPATPFLTGSLSPLTAPAYKLRASPAIWGGRIPIRSSHAFAAQSQDRVRTPPPWGSESLTSHEGLSERMVWRERTRMQSWSDRKSPLSPLLFWVLSVGF